MENSEGRREASSGIYSRLPQSTHDELLGDRILWQLGLELKVKQVASYKVRVRCIHSVRRAPACAH
jgi:hypothetical protein